MLAIGLVAVCAFGTARAQQDDTIHDSDLKVLGFEKTLYPHIAMVAHVEGVVVVRVKLDDQGHVVEAVAISGTELLIPGCLTNARKWQFQPNSQKAAIIVYNFRLKGVCGERESNQFILQRPNLASITACSPTVQP